MWKPVCDDGLDRTQIVEVDSRGGWREGVEEDGGKVSQSQVEVCWTVCCKLAANRQLPSLLGYTPSGPKKDGGFQKRLKLSIKGKLLLPQVDLSQVTRASIQLKCPAPRLVGMDPEIKPTCDFRC